MYVHKDGQFLDLTGRMGYKIFTNTRSESQVNYAELDELAKEENGVMTCTETVFDDCINSVRLLTLTSLSYFNHHL